MVARCPAITAARAGAAASTRKARSSLNNCTLSGNIADGADGGGGILINGGTLLLTNCTVSANFANNNSSQYGGGICWVSYTTIYLVNTVVASNIDLNGSYPDIYAEYGSQNS